MNLIAYLRVSTKEQGHSGLGIEAQRAAVEAYAQAAGAVIAHEFIEIESGRRSNRPKLEAALKVAKRSRGKLVIAKLDRLTRNVAFLSALMESGVEFVCCDNPSANKLTIHILAAVAEDELRRISERTKAALAAAAKRGTLLGSSRPGHWEGRDQVRLQALERGRARSIEVRRAKAREMMSDLSPEIRQKRTAGESYAAIATALNTAGHRTARGYQWTAMAVKRVADRLITEL